MNSIYEKLKHTHIQYCEPELSPIFTLKHENRMIPTTL